MSGRSTPQSPRKPGNKTTAGNRLSQQSALRGNDNVLASLRATQIIASKPVLPAELIATILDYLPVPDLLTCARVSRRVQEMVYDDTRWIHKLKTLRVWNEAEARQRVEEAMKRKAEAQRVREADEAKRTGVHLQGSVNGIAGGGVTLFDAGVEETRYKRSLEQQHPHLPPARKMLADGFDELAISPSSPTGNVWDAHQALTILTQVRSIRGRARQEFGKVYGTLAPLYLNLVRSKRHSDATVFRIFRDPDQQAKILAALKQFARCDDSGDWQDREQKLDTIIAVFETAVLREFEQGFAAGDIDGRMHRYAHVLATLNAGSAAVDFFVSHHPVMARQIQVGNPLDCLEAVAPGHVDLNPVQMFFENLANKMVEQAEVIDRVFPETIDVLTPFLSRMCEEIIAEYLTALIDDARGRGSETYVKAVAGSFEQGLRFVASLRSTKASPPDFHDKAQRILASCFERYFESYIAQELSVFNTKSTAEVTHWERELSEQEASKESFFMSNLNRQQAKRDFLSSFKKVVMMPVNVLPAFNASKASASKAPANPGVADTHDKESRTSSSTLDGPLGTQHPKPEAPTTELAAKAAIMNSRLEGIKSLFSIEVALSLTHLAKACIERMAPMVRMGPPYSEEVKEQCNVIFITMLGVLGDRHVKNGFDKAVGHLSTYNPREVRGVKARLEGDDTATGSGHGGVEPLVTFLELVNVGDLIQQMIDVFFAQELVATKLTEADDFLSPAVKQKKHFEQMLDERVAAGLNRGIDVLMDEIELICATTQSPTDFNPGATSSSSSNGAAPAMVDIGVSRTATEVVEMVNSHTSMLVGSTDKHMLDVFTQEVGLRLFAVLCKHFKRQRISVDGAIKFISDINHYSAFVANLRQKPLMPYFQALREMSQIYLVHIDPPATLFGNTSKAKRSSLLSSKGTKTAAQAKELATIIADSERYRGIFPSEEVYEFAERRADWYLVKAYVESALYGVGCSVM
ncbi:exocyst complex component Sec10-like protein [Neohortaea acidophila]|uniref:Exocyst complex component Sec10-like protein n=1 Tax=Neohortaea acidophila TaxID=245834 RepID=A0A6A6PLU4_9PEZI|nr:exocyst complex component Sec10-like protein [Neohortaea acidophila]KAF2480634.1 exocyst complex component Sec10-like protein [Neohortaea acidophila]